MPLAALEKHPFYAVPKIFQKKQKKLLTRFGLGAIINELSLKRQNKIKLKHSAH